MGSGRGKARRTQYSSPIIGEMADVDHLLSDGDKPFDLSVFYAWKEKGMIGQPIAMRKSDKYAKQLHTAFRHNPKAFWKKFSPALSSIPDEQLGAASFRLLYLLEWLASEDKTETRRALEGLSLEARRTITVLVKTGDGYKVSSPSSPSWGRSRYEALSGILHDWTLEEEEARLEREQSLRRQNVAATIDENVGVVRF